MAPASRAPSPPPQAEAAQQAVERRAEELAGAEGRLRELQGRLEAQSRALEGKEGDLRGLEVRFFLSSSSSFSPPHGDT